MPKPKTPPPPASPIHCRLGIANAAWVQTLARDENNSYNAVANRLIEQQLRVVIAARPKPEKIIA